MKNNREIYEIGKTLGLSETDIKMTFLKNRDKILIGIIVGFASLMFNRVWFEPLHYTIISITDFDFFSRFF